MQGPWLRIKWSTLISLTSHFSFGLAMHFGQSKKASIIWFWKKNLKIHTGRFTFQAILYCPSFPLISIKKPISLRVMKLSRALCREDEVIPRERPKYNLERGLSITFEGIVV